MDEDRSENVTFQCIPFYIILIFEPCEYIALPKNSIWRTNVHVIMLKQNAKLYIHYNHNYVKILCIQEKNVLKCPRMLAVIVFRCQGYMSLFLPLLAYSCFTMLSYFLPYSKLNQPCIYIHSPFFGFYEFSM